MKEERRDRLHLAIIVLLFVALFGLLRNIGDLTGAATYGSQQEVLQEVQSFVQSFPPLQFTGQGASVCIVIALNGGGFYSYTMEKDAGGATITPLLRPDCATSDFVLKFVSYEAFRNVASNPSCGAFLGGGRGEDFWYLPSKLWPPGDMPLCNAEFQQKYCPALYYCGEPAELAPGILSCCGKEQLSATQIELAAAAVQSGIDADARGKKSAVLESPLGGIGSILAWSFGVLVVIGLILGAMLFMKKGESRNFQEEESALETLQSYINMTRTRGFSDAEIANELRQKGWPDDMVDANLKGE